MLGCESIEQQAFRDSPYTASATSAPSKWSSSAFPLAVKVSTDFDSDEDSSIRDMAQAWNDSVNNATQFMDASYSTSEKATTNLDSYEDGTIGVYKMTSWPSELPLTALAITQVIGIRKNIGSASEYIRIEHADILVNYDIFEFTTDYTWGYDLPTIVLHEMGHLIGLYHDQSSVDDSVMYPTITRYVDNRYPKERDIQNVEAKYGISRDSTLSRSIASVSDSRIEQDSDPGEKVIIQHFLMADGTEFEIIK